jgi:hypothetical protein
MRANRIGLLSKRLGNTANNRQTCFEVCLQQQDYELVITVSKQEVRPSKAPSRRSHNASEHLIPRF